MVIFVSISFWARLLQSTQDSSKNPVCLKGYRFLGYRFVHVHTSTCRPRLTASRRRTTRSWRCLFDCGKCPSINRNLSMTALKPTWQISFLLLTAGRRDGPGATDAINGLFVFSFDIIAIFTLVRYFGIRSIHVLARTLIDDYGVGNLRRVIACLGASWAKRAP